MTNLIAAEWNKITGHRWLTGLLIWIFPIGAIVFATFFVVAISLSETFRLAITAEPPQWTSSLMAPWGFPSNFVGRMLLLGFAATLFAGEYQWGTWKNIVPRSERVRLLLAKYIAIGFLVIFAFLLTSIIWGIGNGLGAWAAGIEFGPAVTGESLRQFAGDYLLQAVLALVATTIAVGYATVAATISKSILGGVLVGMVITIAEASLILPLMLLYGLTQKEFFLELYIFTPLYNLENIRSLVNTGERFNFTGNQVLEITQSFEFSLIALVTWMIGLVLLTFFLFRRQDITS